VKSARLLFAALLSALLVGAVLFGACTASPLNISQNDFIAPTGLAITSARDRDLLFVASSGGDQVRALTLCTTPTVPDGGGVNGYVYANTCPANEDFHFLPGPIRVFSGGIETGDRPARLAGVRLCMSIPDAGPPLSGDCSDGGTGLHGGAVLVAGATVDNPPAGVDAGAAGSELRIIDAANLVDAANKVAVAVSPDHLALEAPAVDVAAPDLPGSTVPAWVVTQATGAQPAQLIGFQISESPTGAPVQSAQARWTKCSLAITPRRLALVPGADFNTPGVTNYLYVADGSPDAGQSALEIDVASIPPWVPGLGAPCTIHRPIIARLPVPDGDGGFTDGGVLPFRALALNPLVPNYLDGGVRLAAGQEMIGISVDGLVIFVRMDLGVTAPIPPYGLNDLVGGGPPQAMEPLRTPGLAREIAFMVPPPPARGCNFVSGDGGVEGCSVVTVGDASQMFNIPLIQQPFPLVAIATTSEGGSYFLHGLDRRLINNHRDATVGSVLGIPPGTDSIASITPPPGVNQPTPTIAFPGPQSDPAGGLVAGKEQNGWVNSGVTVSARWRSILHAAIPGLERRAGVLTQPGGPGTALHFETSPADLKVYQASPTLALGAGDVVAFSTFTALGGSEPDGGPINTVCPDLLNFPVLSLELPITAIPTASGMDLNPTGTSAFDHRNPATFAPAASCFPVAVNAEVRVAGSNPWIVLEGNRIKGRAQTGTLFVGYENRFDYPTDYLTANYKTPTRDIAVAFTIVAPEPILSGTELSFNVTSGESPSGVSDATTNSIAYAGPIITYTSPKVTNLVFTSITGANTVLQFDPSLLGFATNSSISYR